MNKLKISSKKIRRRYLLALAVVAVLVTISELIITRSINLQKNDANTINKAGQQRMLSQKMAYFSNAYQFANAKQQNLILINYQNATSTFNSNHAFLTSLPDLSIQLRTNYFDGIPSLDSEVKEYIAAAKLFVEQPSKDNARYFSLERSENILRRLNDVVSLFEQDAEQQVSLVSKLKTSIWLITLVVLCIEALFIFYPMEKLVVRSVNRLKTNS